MKKYIVTLSLAIHFCLSAYIVETSYVSTILEYLPITRSHTSTLVVFDVDNVLGKMESLIGSPEWFYHFIQNYVHQGMSFEDALAHTLPLYHAIQHSSNMIPIESDIKNTVKEIQKRSTYTIAMTSRGFHLAYRTVEQLRALGIDFSSTSFFYDAIYKTHECFRGIVCCNGNNKGSILIDLLKRYNYTPSTIIVINDKQKYLEHIEQELSDYGIQFIGIRYNKLDHWSTQFNASKADQELLLFVQNKALSLPYIPDHNKHSSDVIMQEMI